MFRRSLRQTVATPLERILTLGESRRWELKAREPMNRGDNATCRNRVDDVGNSIDARSESLDHFAQSIRRMCAHHSVQVEACGFDERQYRTTSSLAEFSKFQKVSFQFFRRRTGGNFNDDDRPLRGVDTWLGDEVLRV